MEYSVFYQKISAPFRSNKKMVYYANKLCTYLFYVAYPIVLVLCFKEQCLLKGLFVPAVSFGLVSVFRHFYDEPRPYETWDIKPIIHKKTKGHSMPSRHIFSSVIISMCYVMVLPVVGYVLLIVSVLAACIRVIAGVHYPKDVLAGYLIGLGFGIVMMYI